MSLFDLMGKSPASIDELGRDAALESFKAVATQVPAYQEFLGKRGIDPQSITSVEDFATLPLTEKGNYLHAYPLDELCPEGDISQMLAVTATSGSTGEPTFLMMSPAQEESIQAGVEVLLRHQLQVHQKPTLMLIAFAMGLPTAGIAATAACRKIAAKPEYRLTVAAIGVSDFELALSMVQKIGGCYEQILLLGYPGRVKDIIDEGVRRGIGWSKLGLKAWLSGAGMTEKWRDALLEKAGLDDPLAVMSLFGTSEVGMAGFETPLTIALRRRARDDRGLARRLFGDAEHLPMIMQYVPQARYLEAVDGELVFTASQLGVPLVRYNLHDRGGLISFADLPEDLRTPGSWPLPLFYAFGRTDSASIMGVNYYIDQVIAALEDASIAGDLTGRFLMKSILDDEDNEVMRLKVELREGVEINEERAARFLPAIWQALRAKNHEYDTLSRIRREAAAPRLVLRAQGTEEFAEDDGVKRKYMEL